MGWADKRGRTAGARLIIPVHSVIGRTPCDPADRLAHCLVLRKRRGTIGRDWRLILKLLRECRTIPRSASIFRQAAPLRQKPVAIGQRDGEDPSTVAGQPSSHAYLWPEVGDDESLSAWRRSGVCRRARRCSSACAGVSGELFPGGSAGRLVYRARGRLALPDQPVGIDIVRPFHRAQRWNL